MRFYLINQTTVCVSRRAERCAFGLEDCHHVGDSGPVLTERVVSVWALKFESVGTRAGGPPALTAPPPAPRPRRRPPAPAPPRLRAHNTRPKLTPTRIKANNQELCSRERDAKVRKCLIRIMNA
ncbi:hypothetical protein EVAR_79588_1 [Eumeta japonica]|uniref:Uncharacterized protein n=1 Tax=Eumeta variegata TaxID=151549 RepID=A0A4C1UE64_EUMVA|nr:hypothetical protein EVAR_79588_1 [Eumeta japonica]